MRLRRRGNERGIALIIVMIIIVVFAGMAFMLASSTTVETRLARNSSWDTELEWLARSGIEKAKWAISMSGQGPGGQAYHALNQFWAGGTGETNEALQGETLINNQLGHGTFSVKITDCDRKFNINLAVTSPEILNQAFILMGVEATEAPHLVAAIQDWIDPDDNVTMGAQDTESAYYMSLKDPGPYHAKNGPIDDLSEMLWIKGVTPEMYYGTGGGAETATTRAIRVLNSRQQGREFQPSYPVGFVNLFTAISGRFINVNTASPTVLQLIPDVDGNMAQAIVTHRAGPDGTEGNEDDVPFRSIGELANVPGMTPQITQMFSRYFSTRSSTFEVEVEAQIDKARRTYHALVRQINVNQIVTLYMWWN